MASSPSQIADKKRQTIAFYPSYRFSLPVRVICSVVVYCALAFPVSAWAGPLTSQRGVTQISSVASFRLTGGLDKHATKTTQPSATKSNWVDLNQNMKHKHHSEDNKDSCCSIPQNKLTRLRLMMRLLVAGMVSLTLFLSNPPASMASSEQSEPAFKLDAPTPERPQIMFPTSQDAPFTNTGVSSSQGKTSDKPPPILQGLIYLADADKEKLRSRNPNDVLYIFGTRLSAASSSALPTTNIREDTVFVGAKMPLSTIRFPMQFSLYEENILGDRREEWVQDVATKEDVLLVARVCPPPSTSSTPGMTKKQKSFSNKRFCSEEESTAQGKGVAKLITNLPGMEEQNMVIRAAASLPLE